MSLGGTQATGLVRFLIDSFGGAEVYEEAKRQILATTPSPEDLVEVSSDEEEGDVEAAQSSTPAEENDLCLLKDAKPAFPSGPKTLSQTGVPDSFVSENMPLGKSRQSRYLCLYQNCGFAGRQKDTTCTHIRRKHLGVAIECPTCLPGRARWWSGRSFKGHMSSVHPHLKEKEWWFNIQNQAVREALEAVEAASSLPSSKQLPEAPQESVKYVFFLSESPSLFHLNSTMSLCFSHTYHRLFRDPSPGVPSEPSVSESGHPSSMEVSASQPTTEPSSTT